MCFLSSIKWNMTIIYRLCDAAVFLHPHFVIISLGSLQREERRGRWEIFSPWNLQLSASASTLCICVECDASAYIKRFSLCALQARWEGGWTPVAMCPTIRRTSVWRRGLRRRPTMPPPAASPPTWPRTGCRLSISNLFPASFRSVLARPTSEYHYTLSFISMLFCMFM